MRIRRGIVICAAIISIMACTACGNSGEGVSGANGNVTSTGENSTGMDRGVIEQPQVMYNGKMYYYFATGRDEALPEGYEGAGVIDTVDRSDPPTKNYSAAGIDLKIGQEIYISKEEKNVIYLKYDSGYARFERICRKSDEHYFGKIKRGVSVSPLLESSATERVFREDADQQTSYSGGISGRKEKRDFSRKSLSSDGKKESGKRAGRRG